MKNFVLSIIVLSLSTILFAQKIENRTTGGDVEKKMVENINLDKFIDFAPSISADGKTMIFESDRAKGWKLFETKLDENGNWSTPVSIESINNFGRKNDLIAGPNISYDGNSLYFFGFFMLSSESEDIFVSNREAEGWSAPTPLGLPINTDGYEGFPSVSSDGKSMFFIRVNESNPVFVDSLGNEEPCFEVWEATKNENNQWNEPNKLPAPINLGCERSPKILADGNTLLFSSIREGGQGLYDMYQTNRQTDGNWSTPISLDFVNTIENDLSPCISASGDLMYFYSNEDIYQVQIPPKYRQQKNITVEGYVTTKDGFEAVPARVLIKDEISGALISEIENNVIDGWYSLVLTKGHHYTIEFVNENYLPVAHSYDLRELEEYREEHVNAIMSNKINVLGEIVDEELLFKVNAAITIRTKGGETVKTFANVDNFDFELDYKKEYLISVGADKYQLLVDTLTTSTSIEPILNKTFKVKPQKVKFKMDVVNLNNNSKVKSKLVFKNKNRNETIEANSDEFVNLRSGDRYEVESTSEGYFFGTTELVVDELVAGPDGVFHTKEPIVVTPIAVNSSLVLKGIRFDTNSSDLTDDSQIELKRIIQMIKDNPGVVVEIAAHTDDVGDDSYNLNLSKKRAQSVVDYLLQNELNAGNLVPVGYGMTRPSVPNDSEENRAKNRRVEMSILKIN
ncbi:MAG: OmpA family protein [Cyclobacteriaceae bacterium]|nr:OmpA family protein [Cyclobacteriaceae bacterium]